MKLFAIDLHISTSADIKRIFKDLGHEVVDLCLSGHHWVMNRKQDYVKELSGEKWTRLVWDWNFDAFYQAHKESLKSFDGFICMYPPVFAMLYEKFNKPIIIHTPIRFDYAVHGCPERLGKWIAWLREGVKSGRVIFAANSKYDQKYCELFTGFTPKHIPSLCEYFPKRPHGVKNGFLLYEQGNSLSCKVPGIVDRKNAFPGGYKWPMIHRYKGVVHLPYQVSTMSVFEHYSANIPMIFPTPEFLREMFFVGKWNVLSQVSTFQLSRTKPNKSIVPFTKNLDPNNWRSKEVVDKLWLKYADFYDPKWMPHIKYFGSIEELKKICQEDDYNHVSELMAEKNIERKQKVYDSWKGILDGIKG